MKLQITLDQKFDPGFIFRKQFEEIQKYQKRRDEFYKINEKNEDYWIVKELLLEGFNNLARYIARTIIFNQEYYTSWYEYKDKQHKIMEKWRDLTIKYC